MERGDFASGAAPLLFRVHGGMPYGEVKPPRIETTLFFQKQKAG